jgi:antitoxin component YwqK of YwqJK toxin-antitoxin module
MRYTIISLACILLLFACKSKPINQTINKKREGIWIEKYSQDSANYKSIGKYYKDDPIKKWRYYLNGKIIKKEKHKKNNCLTKFYHENGKTQSIGTTSLDTSSKYLHWFYKGKWNYYDSKGKLIMTRTYNNGELISEIAITNQK